jgi:hypothetical protein
MRLARLGEMKFHSAIDQPHPPWPDTIHRVQRGMACALLPIGLPGFEPAIS